MTRALATIGAAVIIIPGNNKAIAVRGNRGVVLLPTRISIDQELRPNTRVRRPIRFGIGLMVGLMID